MSLFFRIALILNGIGSCGLAIAMPYYLSTIGMPHNYVFFFQGVVFLASALGTLFWGNHIDQVENIWLDKAKILSLEILFSILVYVFVAMYKNTVLFCISLAFLEYFFVYEISWSRVAYEEIPANRLKDKDALAQEVTVAAAIISIFAPTIGAFVAIKEFLHYVSVFNLISFLPYLAITLIVYRASYGRKYSRVPGGMTTTFSVFSKMVRNTPSLRNLYLAITFCCLSLAFFMSALPILLFTNFHYDKSYIPLFYTITGIGSVLLSTKHARKMMPSSVKTSLSWNVAGILASGLVFILSDHFALLALGYLLHNFFWISFSIIIMDKIYKFPRRDVHGKLFALYQSISRFTFPLASFLLALIHEEISMPFLVAAFTLSLVGGMFFFSNKRLMETGARA